MIIYCVVLNEIQDQENDRKYDNYILQLTSVRS